MIRFNKRIDLGWNIRIRFCRDFARYDQGWRTFEFGVFRLNKWPPEGCMITKHDYTGFWLRCRIWLPFELER